MEAADYQLGAGCPSPGTAEQIKQLLEAARAEVADRGRRTDVSANLIAFLRREGLFQCLQPSSYGGKGTHATSLFVMQEAFSAIDMSTGWLIGNMGIVAHHLAQFDARAQHAVWGEDPTAMLASSNMPGGTLTRNAGGFELSGNWRFSSGCRHADWLMLGVRLEDDGSDSVVGSCIVPADQVAIKEDWDVIGLRGTGSHSVSVTSVRLATYHFLPHSQRLDGTAPGLAVNDSPLYRIPFPQLQFKAISTSSIGGLRGMLELFSSRYGERTSAMGQLSSADPHVQELCGTISAELHRMASAIGHGLEAVDPAVCDDADQARRRRQARLNATRTPDRCFRYGANLYRAAGSDALRRSSAMTRFLLDLIAARQHVANQFEQHARKDGAELLGEEVVDALL